MYIEDPYKIWVVDKFTSESILDSVLNKWLQDDDPRWFRGRDKIHGEDNVLERGMLSLSNMTLMPKKISSMMKMLHSREMTERISKMTGVKDLITDDSMRWSGMREMLTGGCQLIHSDARLNPKTKLVKHITALLYLNKDYTSDDQGQLEVWNDEMTECVHRIEPIYNRLVLFVNSDTSYHGVPSVKTSRKMLTFSIMRHPTEVDTETRTYAKFVPRPCDSDAVARLGVLRSQLNDY